MAFMYDCGLLYFQEEKNGVVNKDLVNVIVKALLQTKNY